MVPFPKVTAPLVAPKVPFPLKRTLMPCPKVNPPLKLLAPEKVAQVFAPAPELRVRLLLPPVSVTPLPAKVTEEALLEFVPEIKMTVLFVRMVLLNSSQSILRLPPSLKLFLFVRTVVPVDARPVPSNMRTSPVPKESVDPMAILPCCNSNPPE